MAYNSYIVDVPNKMAGLHILGLDPLKPFIEKCWSLKYADATICISINVSYVGSSKDLIWERSQSDDCVLLPVICGT